MEVLVSMAAMPTLLLLPPLDSLTPLMLVSVITLLGLKFLAKDDVKREIKQHTVVAQYYPK